MSTTIVTSLITLQSIAGPPAQPMQLNRMKILILETVSFYYSLELLSVKQRL